ncbi:MAG: heme ABC transporter permease [Gammaproteobacteria bacterium]|uniref:Heme exporter protein C n=1 Tax=Candidatus Thiopontia autotrophica TaxID=2841688 RepID=A0A8J6P7L4_9GAMM|nr:heme ABC transporter permease [Candidatus Thiopontia autotrophica]MBL6969443.1 heme ABC transporter permease [Gammaproteobacteria bacterium]
MKLPNFIYRFSSPKHFYSMSGKLLPWLAGLSFALMIVGLYIGFAVAPTHSEQGESYRLIYLHVPAASNSMMIYMIMATSGAIFLIWRIKLADTIAAASAPIGAAFTFLALLTGSIWGKPTWGTWWQWDARLTSELILLFLYFGYMALRAAMDDRQNAARSSSVLALVGVVNIPIIHFSVEWWNTLHQGATVSKIAKPSMEMTMLSSMLLMLVALSLFFAVVTLIRARGLSLQQDSRGSWVRDLPDIKVRPLHLLIPVIAIGYVAYHAATTDRIDILSPTELVAGSPTEQIEFRGNVESIQSDGNQHQILVSDDAEKIMVNFAGKLPKQLRTHWGAHVTGKLQSDSGAASVNANSIAALNIRDHSSYVIAGYSIAFVVFLLNLLGALRTTREAKLSIARRIRQENN